MRKGENERDPKVWNGSNFNTRELGVNMQNSLFWDLLKIPRVDSKVIVYLKFQHYIRGQINNLKRSLLEQFLRQNMSHWHARLECPYLATENMAIIRDQQL